MPKKNKTKQKQKNKERPFKSKKMKVVIVPEKKRPQPQPSSRPSVARTIGHTLGSLVGGPHLGNLAGDAAAWFSKIIGFGDYKVNSNTLTVGNQIPEFVNRRHRTVLTNREYLFDLTSTTGFANTGYVLNPGNSVLFPWLSTIAQNYECYKFLGLVFEFRSTSGASIASVNTALGSVIMATNYDPTQPTYPDRRSMENCEYSTTCSPADSMIHPIECMPGSGVIDTRYVTGGNTVLSGDQNLYNMAKFQIGTVGMQAAGVTLGEVWVSYHVELTKPRISPALATSIDTYKLQFILSPAGGLTSIASGNNGLPLTYSATTSPSSGAFIRLYFNSVAVYGTFLVSCTGALGNTGSATVVANTFTPNYSPNVSVLSITCANTNVHAYSLGVTNAASATDNTNTILGSHYLLLFTIQKDTTASNFVEIPINLWTAANCKYSFYVTRISDPGVGAEIVQSEGATSEDKIRELIAAEVAARMSAHGTTTDYILVPRVTSG